MNKLIAIAGNLGIGKTTLTKRLARHLRWKPYFEPHRQNPYLTDFYQDMKRWAFHSQMFFLGKRMDDCCKMMKEQGSVVQDRTIFEDGEIFAKYLYQKKYINKRDWRVYKTVYGVGTTLLPSPNVIIYLRASVDKIMARIADKKRPYGNFVNREYIEGLNTLYDVWAGHAKKSKIIIINYDDLDLERNEKDFLELVQMVKKYV